MPKADGKTIQQRFDERYRVDKKTGCWNWTAGLNGKGYAYMWVPIDRPGSRYPSDGSTLQAYKIGWLLKFKLKWKDLAGLDLHHVCENTKCVNWKHLAPGTRKKHKQEHLRAECVRGHPFMDGSFFININGARICKKCSKILRASYYAKIVAKRKADGTYVGPSETRTHCKHGHEYTPENTRLTKTGGRICKACHKYIYPARRFPNRKPRKLRSGKTHYAL